MTLIYYLSLVFFILLCAVLCLVVLVQESKSLGLGASFGGDPGDSLFGTSTADILKKLTGWLAVAFMAACLLLSLWTGALSHHKADVVPLSIEELE